MHDNDDCNNKEFSKPALLYLVMQDHLEVGEVQIIMFVLGCNKLIPCFISKCNKGEISLQ